ncbi:hypothetical protein VTN02DRAFT_6583 [Thermoascus thermophilus]
MADQTEQHIPGRLFPAVVDELAETTPDRKFCSMPKGPNVSDGFRDITVKELAKAVNYTAWWIEKRLGRSDKLETLAYMAANDVRYLVVILAANKAGYKVLLPSSRNSDEAFQFLLTATECSKFLYSPERKLKVLEIKNNRPNLELLEVPSLDEMLEGETSVYPYTKTFEEAEDEVSFIIHSSGTTGMPKPVPLTHGYVTILDRFSHIRSPPGRIPTMWSGLGSDDLMFATTPFFHLMGYLAFTQSGFHGVPFVIGPEKPLTPDYVVDVINVAKPTAALLPPSILEEMYSSPRALEALGRLRYLYYGGAPLSPDAGDVLCKVTDLRTVIGTSEVGIIVNMPHLEREDWQYFDWNPNYPLDMRPVEDGLYELVIPRGKSRELHGIFHTFPDLKEYHTKDVFLRHPTKPHLYKFHGRIDDVIVLSNGEKFTPVTMEKIIEGHPLVQRALIVGERRFQAALLVEPNWNQWSEDKPASELIEAIWPTVEQANQNGPAHGRIMKTKIGVASRDKPFKTTPKGSTQRRLVIKDYTEEINAIYEKNDEELVELPEVTDLAGITEYVRKLVSSKVETPDLSDKDDFYVAGLDSLQTMHLGKVLQSAVRSRYPDKNYGAITSQKVYANPTVEQLSRFLSGIINGDAEDGEARVEKIDRLLNKYTADLPEQELDVSGIPETHTVILTGSTGSLGNYLLSVLLNDPKVAKVYCMNRSDAKSRQEKSFQEKGLNFNADKVEFLQVAFGEEKFGLDDDKYEEMLQSVDTIIHNAWKVDFNHKVDSFEEVHIRGVRRFVDFSLKSKHHAHIHFISSVSVIGAWKAHHGPAVPEIPLENPDVTLTQGYGESKHISERICLAASRRSGVPTTIHRVGQIGGPSTEKGQWNRQEWLPTIVATSKSLGKIPSTLGSAPVDWIPVDTLATIIVELVETRRTTQTESRCSVFHLVNPSSVPWTALIPAVQKHYPVKPVELSAWVEELERIENPSESEIAAKPALKLMDFYRGLLDVDGALSAPLEVTKTKEASATMNKLGPVDEALMDNWLRQWAF